jgi:hypothetical protein
MSWLGFACAWPDRQAIRHSLGCAPRPLPTSVTVFLACSRRPTFASATMPPAPTVLSLALPMSWLVAIWLAGGYDVRFIGTGSDEFRKVRTPGVGLTTATEFSSYAVHSKVSRAYTA